jgi:probable phosphoglycerate mutase
MIRIILVRHGETGWNRVERFHSRLDIPLNGTGLLQAKAAEKHIADEWKPVAIYSNPLSRAIRTSDGVAKIHT